MSPTLNVSTLKKLLTETAAEWRTHSDTLQKLDSILGDGDIGVTVDLGGKAIIDYIAAPTDDDIGKILMKCGMSINKASPSTFGTLLASAFMEAGKGQVGKKEIDLKDLGLVGQGAVDGIKKRGGANVGEKTMLDTIVPAVEAFKQAAAGGKDVKIALADVVTAAQKGMEDTKNMKAKHSRASYRPDGGIGVQDAGATAMYYLIEAFCKKLTAQIN
ncbi:MAG: dihydroxyacetone kinase subunit L [Dehalococcoidales bacterium]